MKRLEPITILLEVSEEERDQQCVNQVDEERGHEGHDDEGQVRGTTTDWAKRVISIYKAAL
jgi:hypothetical protein